jgi:FG-GAP-like repeat
MGLTLEATPAQCSQAALRVSAPAAAVQRIPGSQAVRGQKNIQWAWLGSPTLRYPHTALGAATHAGSLHAMVSTAAGAVQELVYQLPLNRVFEDRVPRLVDLDGDGRDELIVIESDALKGSAVVVFGVRANQVSNAGSLTLTELARSPHTGSTFRWLNPVGVADFDGDGQQDIASVTTPHVGGMLTLYHYRPPKLEPYAQAMDVSNHRMGDLEQQLAVIVAQSGSRPTIIVPDMQLKALHALRWEAPGKWKELADVKPLTATVQRLTPLPGGACLLLTDATWWRVRLMH